MRIGIDGRALTGRYTGDRTYWRNLIRAHIAAAESESGPKHTYFVYSRLPFHADALPVSPRIVVRTVPSSNDRLWTMLTFPRLLRQDGIHLAHTQYTTPIRTPCPIVTTVHDISFRLYPEWFPRKHRILLNLSVPSAMRRATRVITDSEASRRDILRVYHMEDARVVGIPLAAGPEFGPIPEALARREVADRYRIEDPYFLTVGVLQPRKNFALLVEAFARARANAGLPHKLLLCGKRGWAAEELVRQVARLQISNDVLMTDYVPDSDLPILYSAATAMAFPSLYEGFGLPPLEAMACGAPTLVSDAPAMPEVAGDGAWVLPVMDSVAWADALVCVASDCDAKLQLRERGQARARRFSWEATAAMTRKVYEAAAGA